MSDKRTFLDRLLHRTEKVVPQKDEQGKVIGQTLFQYDQSGEIIARTESVWDSEKNQFRMSKKKTYTKNKDGKYDPLKTLYFDDEERPIVERDYYREESGMLCCEQKKFDYFNEKGVLLSFQKNRYDGGAWTTYHLEQN